MHQFGYNYPKGSLIIDYVQRVGSFPRSPSYADDIRTLTPHTNCILQGS